jgi:hypothetical protein
MLNSDVRIISKTCPFDFTIKNPIGRTIFVSDTLVLMYVGNN